MSAPVPLARLEQIVDRADVAARIEILLPIGGRPRQVLVRTLPIGMLLTLAGHRPAHLTRVHQALTSLPEPDRISLGVLAGWKHGPHPLTYRRPSGPTASWSPRWKRSILTERRPPSWPASSSAASISVFTAPTTRPSRWSTPPEGKVTATGRPYGNRYISVVTIRNRKIVHWRDYLDPLRVFAALEGPDSRDSPSA